MSQRTISFRKSRSLLFLMVLMRLCSRIQRAAGASARGRAVFCSSVNVTESLRAETLYPCCLKLLVLLRTSSAAVRMLRLILQIGGTFLVFVGLWFFFFLWVPRYHHLLEDSMSWFYWVSHTFESILLLQDTNLCVFCQLAPCWQIPSKMTGIGMPWYCQLLSALKCCLCLSTFQAYCLLEAALVLACRASDWHCSSFQ